MTPIDPKTHMAVDLASCGEIKGVEAVDIDARQVAISKKTLTGEAGRTVLVPAGVRVVRRR